MIDEASNKKQQATLLPAIASKTASASQSGSLKVMHSSMMFDYIAQDPMLNEAIKQFVREKAMKVRDLAAQNTVMTPQALNLGKQDRANMDRYDAIRDHGHYHLKTSDARKGDISVIYKQEIDNKTKSVVLKLATLADHDLLDNKRRSISMADKISSASYEPGPLPLAPKPVKESIYPLFSWLNRSV